MLKALPSYTNIHTRMGIPFYFREIVKGNRHILTNLNRCNRLYLDYNSIIHTASAKVVASKAWRDYDAMEHAIFQSIIAYTHEVVGSCTPDQLLYIGIDGVAPLAKMVQQRRRRHLSAMQNGLINEFKEKNRIPYSQWDSNCITPGTTFMKRLQEVLLAHWSSLTPRPPFETIISGPDEEGEGEHKIIKYIKHLGDDRFTDVIYGLDADLIMLSLTCPKGKIYLMRENTLVAGPQNRRGKHKNTDVLSFKYVDIDTLRDCVGEHLYPQPSNNRQNKRPYMHDYVFICFVLGNDFLPHFLALDIKYEGLETICGVYRNLHEQTGKHIIAFDEADKKYHIDHVFLDTFFQELANLEDGLIRKNIKTFFEAPYTPPPAMSPLERFVTDLNLSPLRNRKKEIDPDNDPFWKSNYYMTFLRTKNSDICATDKICKNLVDGLTWNVDYYFNGIATNTWHYTYPTAPLIADVSRYIKKIQSSQNPPPPPQPIHISAAEQLLIVLPYKSLGLLPPHTADLIRDPMAGYAHMYPLNFHLKTFLKAQLWECTPILPPIDVPKVKALAAANS